MKTLFTFFTFFAMLYTGKAQLSINFEPIDPICYGLCNGKIKITGVTGGTAPYTLSLQNSNQTITNYNGTDTVYFDSLCAAIYTVVITDSFNSTVHQINLYDPPQMTYSVTTTNPTCHGFCNGSAQITVQNGTPPYQIYLNGQYYNYGNIYSLCANTYYPLIIDSNGCSIDYANFEIQEPNPLMISFNENQPNNCNNTNGTLTATVSGGTAPYTYLWSTDSTTNYINNIGVGIYHLTVSDVNGCTLISHYALNAYNSNIVLMGTPPTCYGNNNGMVFLNNSPTFIYPAYIKWSNGSSILMFDTLFNTNSIADTLINVTASSYYITITDANCSYYSYYELTQPDSIKISAYINNVSCNGDSNGSIYIIYVSGGNGNFSYQWNNNSNSQYLYNLIAGNYSVTVTDNLGCTNSATYTITEPLPLSASVIPVNVSCFGANDAHLLVFPSGATPPYYYSLDTINNYNYQELNDSIIWLDSIGIYNLFIKDLHYCDTISFFNLQVKEPEALSMSYTYTNPSCSNNDGSIELQVTTGTGTPPYTLLIDTIQAEDSLLNLNNLSANNYFLVVTDANGCEVVDSIKLILASQLPVITGTVLYNQTSVDTTKILLFKAGQFGAAQMDTLIILDGPNFYINDVVYPGTYYLKALYEGTTLSVWNTYYNNTIYWTDATPVILNCDDTVNIDIELLEQPSQTLGSCSISGYIHFVNSNGTKAISEPVPGAEITVEQVPGPTIIKMAITDTTGYYELNNLPDLPNCSLRVDIPGIPLLSTYTGLSVNSNGVASLTNLNFIVDTTTNGGIMKDSATWTHSIYSTIQSISINPNPFISVAFVEMNILQSENISYEIIDITGKKIYSAPAKFFNKGINIIQIHDHEVPQSGVYYFVAHSEKNIYFKKIIKQ